MLQAPGGSQGQAELEGPDEEEAPCHAQARRNVPVQTCEVLPAAAGGVSGSAAGVAAANVHTTPAVLPRGSMAGCALAWIREGLQLLRSQAHRILQD